MTAHTLAARIRNHVAPSREQMAAYADEVEALATPLTTRDQYAEVLAAHRVIGFDPPVSKTMCVCDITWRTEEERQAHVTDALAAALPDPEPETPAGVASIDPTSGPVIDPTPAGLPDPEQAVREALDKVERRLIDNLPLSARGHGEATIRRIVREVRP